MTNEEHETTLNFDYAHKVLRVFTTRRGVYDGFVKRLGAENIQQLAETDRTWAFVVDLKLCRSANAIAKLINPDAKTPMSDERKAQLKALAS